VLSDKKLTFTLNGRTYVKKTNSNGRAALKVKIAAGKYRLRIYHYKSGVYDYKKKSATLTVQKNTPKISVENLTVIKDKYLYVYLKDKAGSVMKSHKVKIRINGKTYTKTTNSNGRAALKLSMAAKSYSTKISFDAVSVYSSKSVTKTIKVINDPYKNSILNIEKAATNVRNYVDDHGKLPETVTVGSETVTIEEFSYLMGEAIVALNKGSTGKVSILSGIGNVNSTNTSLNTKVFKAEYLDLANRVVSHINTNKVPAAQIEVYNSSKAKVGNANFDLYTYCFAKILNFYRTDGYLPNWCTFESDVFDDTSIIPSNDTSPGKVTTADSSDFKKGLNEKNTVSDLSQYLKAGGHCALNQAIKNKAASLTKGLTTTAAKAYAIFNYVRDGIEYSYYADSKKDASGTLSSGSANCCDQANLVVALCRAAGIPARYSHAQGCTFSSGLVTGHVWAQILVGDTWYAADATSSRNKLGDINNWNTNSYNTLKQYALIPF
ncbi:MAG: transglutaminase-like domain-containing protein, partial [Methanobrevibacter sp.]|nr:transglutaminase-like domain-containing protein [Methanobrevibacter sp.]